jgi:hypothetical protein
MKHLCFQVRFFINTFPFSGLARALLRLSGMESQVKLLLLLSLVVTAFLTGLIWFVQVVHYPGFQKVGEPSFVNYHHFHTSATGLVVVVPMLLELVLAAVLVGLDSNRLEWLSLGLVLAVWLLTFALIVPVHGRLESGFDLGAARKLVQLNLIRALLWTSKLLVVGLLCKKEFLG